MPYRAQNLSVLAFANGFSLWHYKTTDAGSDIDTIGYFSAAAGMLRVGDMIMVNVGIGATPTHGMMVVSSNTNGVVDVTNMTAFGATNTD